MSARYFGNSRSLYPCIFYKDCGAFLMLANCLFKPLFRCRLLSLAETHDKCWRISGEYLGWRFFISTFDRQSVKLLLMIPSLSSFGPKESYLGLYQCPGAEIWHSFCRCIYPFNCHLATFCYNDPWCYRAKIMIYRVIQYEDATHAAHEKWRIFGVKLLQRLEYWYFVCGGRAAAFSGGDTGRKSMHESLI